MNRFLVLGVAIFFALVGLAMIGGESQAVAGHGCNGCKGVGCVGGGHGVCAGIDCGGKHARCAGRRHARAARCGGLKGDCGGSKVRCGGIKAKHRRRCAGVADCCGTVVHDCGGHGGKMMDAPVQGGGDIAPPPPPAPTVEGASVERSSLIFRRVSFRR